MAVVDSAENDKTTEKDGFRPISLRLAQKVEISKIGLFLVTKAAVDGYIERIFFLI